MANTTIWWSLGVYVISIETQNNIKLFSSNALKRIFNIPLIGFLMGVLFVFLYNEGWLEFWNKDAYIFGFKFEGDVERLQEVINSDIRRLRIIFSLFPFGLGLWDVKENKKFGTLLVKIW